MGVVSRVWIGGGAWWFEDLMYPFWGWVDGSEMVGGLLGVGLSMGENLEG